MQHTTTAPENTNVRISKAFENLKGGGAPLPQMAFQPYASEKHRVTAQRWHSSQITLVKRLSICLRSSGIKLTQLDDCRSEITLLWAVKARAGAW